MTTKRYTTKQRVIHGRKIRADISKYQREIEEARENGDSTMVAILENQILMANHELEELEN